MKYKYSLLGLAAGTALLVASGCSKQESTAQTQVDNTPKTPAPVAAAKPQAVESPKPADKQPAEAAKPAAAAVTTPAPTTPAPSAVVTQPANAMANAAVTTVPAVPAVSTNSALASAVRTAVQTQQVSLTQSATNQVQTFAATATNQVQALAAVVTNQVLSALGMTNQVASTATNQVQALLENAKNLSANQKYQEALSNLTQLYTTKLTPEQKQKADDLKTQIEAQVQSNLVQKASSALGNFFGGKK